MDRPNLTDSLFHRLPKVELHRHLEGSVRLQTLREIIRHNSDEEGLPSLEQIGQMVQVSPADRLTSANFLAKFMTLRSFYLSAEIIRQIAYESVIDAAGEGVRYLELRFTPTSLARRKGFPLGEVIDWVCESCRRASEETGIVSRLIISLNRHDSVELAEQVVRLAVDKADKGIVGIDLAGNEADFPVEPFIGLLREACQDGLQLTIHAGEWGGAQNVRQAILDLGARRIGHGVRVMEDPSVAALAREREVVFEVCPSSNYASGVVASLKEHPLPAMMAAGLKFTLNTDDPAICGITLGNEYAVANQIFGISIEPLIQSIWTGLEAGFLKADEKSRLRQHLRSEMAAFERERKRTCTSW